ncbi:MAG: hypothetical protein R2911_06020 [Caldilineaceae bacterium]
MYADLQMQMIRFQQLPGQVGPAILVSTERPVINVQVKLPIYVSQVPGGDTNGLELMRFDEETVQFKHLGRAGANASQVWADSSSVGIFILIHMPTWEAQWNSSLQIIQNAVTAANAEEDTDGMVILLSVWDALVFSRVMEHWLLPIQMRGIPIWMGYQMEEVAKTDRR